MSLLIEVLEPKSLTAASLSISFRGIGTDEFTGASSFIFNSSLKVIELYAAMITHSSVLASNDKNTIILSSTPQQIKKVFPIIKTLIPLKSCQL